MLGIFLKEYNLKLCEAMVKNLEKTCNLLIKYKQIKMTCE